MNGATNNHPQVGNLDFPKNIVCILLYVYVTFEDFNVCAIIWIITENMYLLRDW